MFGARKVHVHLCSKVLNIFVVLICLTVSHGSGLGV
jgi:hypothetical protein